MLRSDEETRIVAGGSRTFGVCPLVKQMQAVHHLTGERGEASTGEVRAIIKYSLGPFVCRLEAEALLIGEKFSRMLSAFRAAVTIRRGSSCSTTVL
jgi:hypothetical protein